jgi:hypothetical protein
MFIRQLWQYCGMINTTSMPIQRFQYASTQITALSQNVFNNVITSNCICKAL